MKKAFINIEEYDFDFPEDLIAQRAKPKGESDILRIPLPPKKEQANSSRAQQIQESFDPNNTGFYKLPAQSIIDELESGDCLVVNNTKVIPARLHGQKTTGAKFELLLVGPQAHREGVVWESWVRPGKHFKLGASHQVNGIPFEVVEVQEDGTRVLKFDCQHDEFDRMLEEVGKVPLPPYIEREADDEDKESYQTVFAKHKGAVAAPTASLHFSEEMMKEIKAKGIHVAEVTLHVGPGTFKPVETENALDHPMHGEAFHVEEDQAEVINQAKSSGGRIISVGTTSTRVLETMTDENGQIQAGEGVTHAFIYPGYEWKMVDGLITNFHWPKSTLMLLVASIAGRERILKAYEYAFEQKMRLFSYGDGMLIL